MPLASLLLHIFSMFSAAHNCEKFNFLVILLYYMKWIHAIVLTQFQQHAKDPGFDSGQATNPVVLATSLGGLYQKGHQCQIKHNTLKYLFLLLLFFYFIYYTKALSVCLFLYPRTPTTPSELEQLNMAHRYSQRFLSVTEIMMSACFLAPTWQWTKMNLYELTA